MSGTVESMTNETTKPEVPDAISIDRAALAKARGEVADAK